MMKVKRLIDFRFPFVVLISKFLEDFGVDLDDELQESTNTFNHISCLTLHKIRFTKENNSWIRDGVVVGANDDEVGPSGAGQRHGPSGSTSMITYLIRYNPLEDRGPTYSPFKCVVLD